MEYNRPTSKERTKIVTFAINKYGYDGTNADPAFIYAMQEVLPKERWMKPISAVNSIPLRNLAEEMLRGKRMREELESYRKSTPVMDTDPTTQVQSNEEDLSPVQMNLPLDKTKVMSVEELISQEIAAAEGEIVERVLKSYIRSRVSERISAKTRIMNNVSDGLEPYFTPDYIRTSL
jgi:hypothetical protein